MATTKHGVVTSTKMTGTVTVTVHRSIFHPLYKKRYRRSRRYLVDPTGHEVHTGDEVCITECRPLSKRKHFRIMEVVKRAARVSELVEEGAIEQVIHRVPTVTEKHSSDSSYAAPKGPLRDGSGPSANSSVSSHL